MTPICPAKTSVNQKVPSSPAVMPKGYELLRPVVLFGDPAIQRAQETGEPRTSLARKADAFDEQGMVSIFASRPRKQPQETARKKPQKKPDVIQLPLLDSDE